MSDNLEAGLVESPDLPELGDVIPELALGVAPAVSEGNSEEVHMQQANVAVQTVAGDAQEREVVG
jgi:hypothetical protein